MTTSCKKPAYHAERNSCQEGMKPHLTNKRKSKEKTPQRYLGKTDQRSVPLCNKHRKLGQTSDCPIHQMLSENKPRQIATMETTYKVEDELRSTPKRTSEPKESKAESFEVEDPYDGPQYNSTSPREETNIGTIRMALMSVVDHDDINYEVKLAVMHQLEETFDQKVIRTLVKEPKKEAMGAIQKNPKENQKGNKGKGKPEPALTPIFDMKLRMSRNSGKHPTNRLPSAKRMLTAHVKIAG